MIRPVVTAKTLTRLSPQTVRPQADTNRGACLRRVPRSGRAEFTPEPPPAFEAARGGIPKGVFRVNTLLGAA